MVVAFKIVKYIRSSAKNRPFKAFMQEIENSKFSNLLEPIKQFVIAKEKLFPKLEDAYWLIDMAIFTGILNHLQS